MVALAAVLATCCAGLLVGVELAIALFVQPMTLRLVGGATIDARAYIARAMGRAMPFWYATTVILTTLLATLSWGTTTGIAAVVASILFSAGIVISVALLVPINKQVASWSSSSYPDEWKMQCQRWDHLHQARVATIGLGFLAVTVATASL